MNDRPPQCDVIRSGGLRTMAQDDGEVMASIGWGAMFSTLRRTILHWYTDRKREEERWSTLAQSL